MDNIFERLLLDTRFTTNKIPKRFLLRRVGLGYAVRHQRISRDDIRPCLKTRRAIERTDCFQEDEEDAGRSELVRKRPRP
ncbi:ECU07_0965 [Encephalitozoon cuniculi GB-M1]|uniref:ECU07_0965 protein n=1 Tax=Encephalitozoon cuniculi (strain GB-M1) TaxID=284813 RepID=I7JU01_ENCCU|nr:uncharacterized protein ECU07_0965 [Encephalitozoon cuniculi GB-M1]CCI73954.1 ECU07_0965 [Encephalitozoon cuniculi GB-M1]